MRKKSRGTHEKQIISLSMLSPTSYLTVKITQHILPPPLNFNLNQTVIHSEEVTIKSQSHSFIWIGFPSKVSNGRPMAAFLSRGRVGIIAD
jgi:hypothetical protein